jgi:hypothetical protein
MDTVGPNAAATTCSTRATRTYLPGRSWTLEHRATAYLVFGAKSSAQKPRMSPTFALVLQPWTRPSACFRWLCPGRRHQVSAPG